MRPVSLVACVALSALSGCTLYFTGDDDGGDEWSDDPPCAFDEANDIAPGVQLRNPEDGSCQTFSTGGGCDGRCGPCPELDPVAPVPDWGQCVSDCDGRAESDCLATGGCRAAYVNDPTADEGPIYQGCWATAPSGPIQGGGCPGLDAHECSRHDDCSALHLHEAGTPPSLPSPFFACINELSRGCYSNDDCNTDERCTAAEECLPPPNCGPGQECPAVCYGRCIPFEGPACESLQGEAACTSRGDCEPVYVGEDCTCVPDGCTCEIQTYNRCQTR